MRLLPLQLSLLLIGCGGAPMAGEADRDGAAEIRATQGYIVSPGKLVPASDLAAAVRDAGYPCESVTAFGQVELNGKPLDNYKLDCGDRSYLLTWLDGGSRIKPWADDTARPQPLPRLPQGDRPA
jgi:hypothetical protein